MEAGDLCLFACKHWAPFGLLSVLLVKVFQVHRPQAMTSLLCVNQVNCYSLNAVGPSIEKISGPGRYLAVYFASAIASN